MDYLAPFAARIGDPPTFDRKQIEEVSQVSNRNSFKAIHIEIVCKRTVICTPSILPNSGRKVFPNTLILYAVNVLITFDFVYFSLFPIASHWSGLPQGFAK